MSSQQLTPHQLKQKDRGWYSVSVGLVRRTATLVGLLALIVVIFVAYNQWLVLTLEDRARAAVEEATGLTHEIEGRDDYRQIYSEHKAAWDQLEEAKEALAKADFEHALDRGQSCVLTLKAILGLTQGSIRVLSLGGNVEFRRGERGAWKRLRSSDSLNPGDWVKTATDGTARLLFSDGSEFTLRQSTMARLGGAAGGGKETNLAFGNVELNTSQAGSTVSTPKSTARVQSDSEALVSFDRDKGSGRFASFAGSLEVSSKSGGVTRTVKALQQVEQIGDQLSELQDLPAPPVLTGPGNDRAFDFDLQKEITLSWQPVQRARRYQLRISTTRLFATNLIDNVRSKSSARLGIQGEGNFYWQVAAIDRDGANGPWSESRAFRIAKLSAVGEVDDRTPPELEILGTETLGNLVIVNGKTESGASVTINGEAVVLKPDGSFSKTIQMMQGGWVTLEIVAADAWNNESSQKRRVFIDAV